MDAGLIFLQGLGLGITAAAAPGAFQALLINRSLGGGWRAGVWVGIAPLISDPPVVLLLVLLLDQFSQDLLRLVGIIGGVFALYLAWELWGEWRRGSSGQPTQGESLTAGLPLLLKACVMNLLSPGVYTFWTLINGPLFLAAWKSAPRLGGAFLAGFYLAFIGGNLSLVFLFAQAQRLGPRIVRALLLISLVVLVVMAGVLLYRSIANNVSQLSSPMVLWNTANDRI